MGRVTARRPLDAEQQDLATRYLPLARRLARPFKAAWPGERDEFDSVALVALVEAAGSWDPSRGVQFGTFARIRILGALKDVLRRMVASGFRGADAPDDKPRVVQLDGCQAWLRQELAGRPLIGMTPHPEPCEAPDAIDAVEAWLRKLPTKHAAVCRQLYVHGKTQSEAARALRLTQSRVSFMHREALAMLAGTWGREEEQDACATTV